MMYIEHSPSEENLLNNILKRVPTQAAASVYLVDEHEAATPAFPVKNKFNNNHSSNSTIYTNGDINGGYSKRQLEEIVNRSIEFPRLPPLQRFDIAEYKLQQQQQSKPLPIEKNKYQYLLKEEDKNDLKKLNYPDKNNQIQKIRKDTELNTKNQEEAGDADEEQEDVKNYTLIDIVETDEEERIHNGIAEENAAVEVFFKKHQHLLAGIESNINKEPLRRKATTPRTTKTLARAKTELNDHNSTLKDIKINNIPDTVYKIVNVDTTCGEESEIEYKIIKENTKSSRSRTKLLNGKNFEASSTFPYNPFDKYTSRSGKNQHKKYYLPAKHRSINAYSSNKRGIKRKAPTPHRYLRTHRRRKSSSSAYAFEESNSSDSDNDEDLYQEAVKSALQAVAETIYKKGKSDSQMGLNIFTKIREFFNFNKSNNTKEERLANRKRRLAERSSEEESFPHIKYRRVENSFPKYVEVTSEDDLLTTSFPKNSNFATSRKMAERQIKLRKSLFEQPKTTRKIMQNNVYADIEFSDDDEIELERQANTQHLLKNITFKRPFGQAKLKSSVNAVAPATSTKPFDFGGSSLLPSTSFLTYAEVTKNAVKTHNLNGNIQSSKINNSIQKPSFGASNMNFSFHSKDKATENVFNGLKNLPNRPLFSKRHTMLDQQKQYEDHKNYLQLLQGLMPGTYGNENSSPAVQKYILPSPKNKQTSSTGSGGDHLISSNAIVSLNTRHRQPLCSTINLLDDDDEVEFTGVLASSSLRPNSTIDLKKKREMSIKSSRNINEIDDDDDDDIEVSEIIDVDASKAEHFKSKTSERKLVSPVNTLFERIHTSAAADDSWIDEVKSKFLSKKQSRDEELREYEELTSKLEAERQNAEIGLQQRLKSFQIFDPDCVVVDDFPESDDEEDDEPKLVPITAEHHAIIKNALNGPPNEVLVSKFNLNITRRDIYTLQGLNWLNDEVINFYMNLLTERSELKSKSNGLPSVYAMNTFFVSRLLQNGHAGVKRWTRKIDIFSKDILPVPVHVGGVHWCMAIINLKKSSIKYYDSMGTPNPTVLRALEQYLKDESLDKRKQPFDTSSFEIKSVENVPRQMNGSDCGVFSCMFAEFITRNCEITFSQQHMEYFRTKMLLEIVRGELMQ